MKKFQFTQEGLDKLREEYQELIDNKRKQAIDRLQKARMMGDLSENSEYTAAKEDLAFIEGRIKELEEIMANAEVVEQNWEGEIIEIGSRVIVEKNDEKDEFFIVGEFEADPMAKKLSATSPIGKALLGKAIGEKVEIQIPVGKIVYKVVDIKKS